MSTINNPNRAGCSALCCATSVRTTSLESKGRFTVNAPRMTVWIALLAMLTAACSSVPTTAPEETSPRTAAVDTASPLIRCIDKDAEPSGKKGDEADQGGFRWQRVLDLEWFLRRFDPRRAGRGMDDATGKVQDDEMAYAAYISSAALAGHPKRARTATR